MPYYPDFARLLNEHLQANERSASWLANKLGIRPSTVSRWLDGSTRPDSPETVVRIADFLRVHKESARQELLAAVGYALRATQAPGAQSGRVPDTDKKLIGSLRKRIITAVGRSVTAAPEWLANPILQQEDLYTALTWRPATLRFESAGGDYGLDLKQQRLAISSAFGSYMAGLLERENIYIPLEGQVDAPTIRGLENLDSMARVVWACIHPCGPRAIVIGADSGMGKSTVAAWLVRCLWRQKAFDLLLGDSAKTRQLDVTTGAITRLQSGYYDPASCVAKLREQLGLPAQSSVRDGLEDIRDRLVGRRALIVLDNLESVAEEDRLLGLLDRLLSRDVRAIVTTQRIKGLSTFSLNSLVVHLQPLTTVDALKTFLTWHITQYQSVQP